jgi:prolyl 4-hydroxylase
LDTDKLEALGAAGNRLSSFFVYLVAECQGGSTVFPEIARPAADEWCETLKCEDNGEDVQWLEVAPKVGTAIFWYNLDMDGQGNRRTLHAGTPVINGTKVGLNIWTRERRFRP